MPKYMDGLLFFDHSRSRFGGILIEAKSGTQSFDAAVYQLKCYRAALKRKRPGRYLVWGIIERGDESEIQQDALDSLPDVAASEGGADLWVFSNADRIGETLRGVLQLTTASSAATGVRPEATPN